MNKDAAETYKNIVNKINERKLERKDLGRYDYYLMGGAPYKRAFPIINELLRKNKITYAEYEVLKEYFRRQLMLGVSHNKEFILSTYYQFGDTVITDEEKKSIWDGMYKLGLAEEEIDDVVFTGAVRAYAIEKGLLKINPNTKKRVLKRK